MAPVPLPVPPNPPTRGTFSPLAPRVGRRWLRACPGHGAGLLGSHLPPFFFFFSFFLSLPLPALLSPQWPRWPRVGFLFSFCVAVAPNGGGFFAGSLFSSCFHETQEPAHVTGRTAAGRRRQLDTGMPGRHGDPVSSTRASSRTQRGGGKKTVKTRPSGSALVAFPSLPSLPFSFSSPQRSAEGGSGSAVFQGTRPPLGSSPNCREREARPLLN